MENQIKENFEQLCAKVDIFLWFTNLVDFSEAYESYGLETAFKLNSELLDFLLSLSIFGFRSHFLAIWENRCRNF